MLNTENKYLNKNSVNSGGFTGLKFKLIRIHNLPVFITF